MKPYRTYFFIAVSSISLVVVLIIQVTWILKSAKLKEDLFNDKANMVLSRTVEALSDDREACQNIASCVQMDSTSAGPAARIGSNEVHKIDSLFAHYMKVYNVHIEYSFMVMKPRILTAQTGFTNYIYGNNMKNIGSENRLELKLIFPEKRQYIMAEMGPTFITSVVLILVVLFLFWRTIYSLMKEKQLAEHTNDFLNNMTHEFKTPLTNIALAGRMIVRNNTNHHSEKVKYYSDIILDENEKLRLQVEQVLSMTAFERDEVPLQLTSVDVHSVINEALKCIGIQIESLHGNLALKLHATRSIISADKTHLSNAICNLIDNAIKYSDNRPELSVITFNKDNDVVIQVSDKGIGIPKEYQKHIFNKYFRVPTGDVHNVKGFGLGLTYTRRIIELLDGVIEFESQPLQGTTFTITLPNA